MVSPEGCRHGPPASERSGRTCRGYDLGARGCHLGGGLRSGRPVGYTESWDGESAIMYLYGGGYVISSPHSRRKLAGHLANACRARALVPRYHLAPERPFPAAVEDAASDYR